jgi:hypothetical protein
MSSSYILSDNGASSGSAGIKQFGGNDGVLLLQTSNVSGTPTTAISISNTQVVTYTNQPTYTGGTANGVLYLNGSKAVTSGTALVFDGTNLGLGVTPSAWGSYSGALDLKGGGGLGAFNNSTALFNNSYYNGTNYIYKASTGAAYYQMAGNAHQWYNAASGTAGNTVSFTQAMTLDASGNLGLGVTPSAWGGGVFKVIQLGGGGSNISATSGADEQMQIVSNAYYDGSAYKYVIGAHSSRYVQNNGAHQWDTAGSGTAGNAITFTQAMTLDASGRLGVGTTSPASKLSVYGGVGVGSSATADTVVQKNIAGTGSYSLWVTSGAGVTGETYPVSIADAWAGSAIQLIGGPVSDSYGGGVQYFANGNTSPSGAGNAHVWFTRSGVNTYTERARIDSSGRMTTPYQTGFGAHGTNGNWSVPTGGAIVPYDTAIYNTGSNYNASTYTFTAPVAGKYFVSFSALIYPNSIPSTQYITMYASVNGATSYSGAIPMARMSFKENQTTMGSYGVLNLSANDTVAIRADATTTGLTLYLSSGHASFFVYFLG